VGPLDVLVNAPRRTMARAKDMLRDRFPHLRAILQALLVTFLWSTSWVLIKVGLRDIPPVTFAGLRYALAFACLLPLLLRSSSRQSFRRLTGRRWVELVALGILFYALTQGASFVSLAYLPAMTVSLLWNLTTITVAMLGIVLLAEPLTALQWGGVVLNLLGVLIYFYPPAFAGAQLLGLAAVLVGVLANAGSSILGRSINRRGDVQPVVVTAMSMGVGAVLLLTTGVCLQGLPPLRIEHWIIIGWLALVNTAFAFTLWNRTLRSLTAVESSIINSTMLGQIAVLAWLFLGESLSWQRGTGLLLAALGTLMVHIRGRRRRRAVAKSRQQMV
jgi:drug/metabolite transporter (DMT)-like permease